METIYKWETAVYLCYNVPEAQFNKELRSRLRKVKMAGCAHEDRAERRGFLERESSSEDGSIVCGFPPQLKMGTAYRFPNKFYAYS